MAITEINNKLSFFNIYIFFCSPLPPILHHCSHENYSWSRLPIEIFPLLLCEVSKIRLNADLSNCSWSQSCSCLSRILDYRLLEVPCHLTDSVVPEFSNSISPIIPQSHACGENLKEYRFWNSLSFLQVLSLIISSVREDLNSSS